MVHLGAFEHPDEEGEELYWGRILLGGGGCRNLPLGVFSKGKPSSKIPTQRLCTVNLLCLLLEEKLVAFAVML